MKRGLLLMTIFVLSLFWGCRKDIQIEENNSIAKDYTISKINSDIQINLWETLDSGKRTLQLNCSTVKGYGCSNFQISTVYSRFLNKFKISFNGIIENNFCLTSIGPATSKINLGTLPNGTYELDISLERKKISGQLIVTSNQYILTYDNHAGLEIMNSPLNRIPTNTIWGTIGYHTNSTDTLIQTFLDSLSFLGAKKQIYQSGDYGYFKINSSGQILPPENHGYYFVKPFIFNYDANVKSIKTLIRNYGTSFGKSLNIRLHTAKGEEYYS